MRVYRALFLPLPLILALVSGVSNAAEGLPELTQCSELELRVAGLFRVGTASLHLSDCDSPRDQVLAAVPKQFSLELARSFSGSDLSGTAREVLVRNLALDSERDLPPPLVCMADAYVDAGAGDRYDVVYSPVYGLSMYLNNELLRRCEADGSGPEYFMIWFGESPFHRRMRDELLRRASEAGRG